MKSIIKYISILCLTFSALSVYAQAPSKISYQAVMRDGNQALVSNQPIGMKISILQGSSTGVSVYTETQAINSNSNGLVSVEIGSGNLVSGNFDNIDWSVGPYFVQTEIDLTGGTNYGVSSTSQLMSVPYAIYANTALNVMNDLVDDADADPSNEIELPVGGSDGQVLKTDGSGNYEWIDQTVNTNTQLSEAEVDAFVSNNGYLTTEVDGSVTNEIELPVGGSDGQVLKTDGSGNYEWVDQTVNTNTQLSEAEVDAFVSNNGYLTIEVDGSITNEIELPVGGSDGQVLKTDGSGNYEWIDQTQDTQLDSSGIAALGFVAGPHTNALEYLGAARATNESSPNPNVYNRIPSNTYTAVPWRSVKENYMSSLNTANYTDIVIPTGVDYIRINAVITFDQNDPNVTTGGQGQFVVEKNGNAYTGLANDGYMGFQYFNYAYTHNYYSTLIPVTPGEVFTISLRQNSGNDLYLNWGSISSAISFEFYAD